MYMMFLLIIFNLCLNLSRAQNPLDQTAIKKVIDGIQTQAPVNTNPVQPPGPTVYPALPPSAAPATPAVTSSPSAAPIPGGKESLDAEKATSGKYEEYQSICRSHEYDDIQYKTDEVKQARIAIIKKRADSETEGMPERLLLLHEYLHQGDMQNFKKFSTELKNKKSSPRDNEVLNALILLSKKNARSAIASLLKALQNDEKNEKTLKLLAEAYIADNNYYEAGTIYEDLNKQLKNKFLVEQCEALVSNSLNADGEKVCMEAARAFPENPFPYLFVGVTHRERENIPTSIAFFKKSMRVRPTEMGATCLAESYFILKKFPEASKAFEQSLAVNPRSARAMIGMAWAQLKAKDYDASLAAFKRSCNISSRFASEVRKAYKFLSDEKIVSAKKFQQLAESCDK